VKATQEKQRAEKEIAEKELKILKQQREAEQRERQFLQLEKEKALQALELEKRKAQEQATQRQVAQLQQEKEIQTLKSQRQELAVQKQAQENRLLYAILAFILLLAIISFFILLNIRKKNRQLAQQKAEIELKNAELEQTQEELKSQRDTLELKTSQLDSAYTNIKASITYAKRIQTAILPPLSHIQAYLPESFIFFKPRDIVSGDFYWFSPTSPTTCLIAAVDCTGHGVPGAFMSMIGDSLLNQIVEEKRITSPDLILAELNKGIKTSLRKGEQDAKDGMDMAICWVDKSQQLIEIAGAMNPVCVVQNGELREIKADKVPIGRDNTENFVYTKHTIDCSIPTTVYLYSDGYQDQFGGEHDKKFMVAKFRKLLQEITHKPMEEQKEILAITFDSWKGRKEQTDDVLVVGLRI
jgi:serine phosphatase RsbU (regulator of sigma subunit)